MHEKDLRAWNVTNYQSRLKKAKERRLHLLHRLRKKDELCNKLVQCNEDMEAEHLLVLEQRDEWLKGLRKELLDDKREYEAKLQAEREKLEDARCDHGKEIQKIKAEVEAIRSGCADLIEVEKAKLDVTLTTCRRIGAEKVMAEKNLGIANLRLQNARTDRDRHRKAYDREMEKVRSLESQLNASYDELDNVREVSLEEKDYQVRARRKALGDVASADYRASVAEQKQVESERRCADIELDLVDARSLLEKTKDNLSDPDKLLEATNAQLRQWKLGLQASVQHVATLSNKCDTLQQQLQDLGRKNEAAESDWQRKSAELDVARLHSVQKEVRVAELEEQECQSLNDLDAMRRQWDKTSESLEVANSQLSQRTWDLDAAKRQAAELSSRYNDLERRLTSTSSAPCSSCAVQSVLSQVDSPSSASVPNLQAAGPTFGRPRTGLEHGGAACSISEGGVLRLSFIPLEPDVALRS